MPNTKKTTRTAAPKPAPPPPPPPPQPDPQAIINEARTRYGAFASYLDNPEIGPILLQGAREGRDVAWLQGQISKTTWWKNTSAAAREWDMIQRTDPTTANQKREAATAEVRQAAIDAGIALSQERLSYISTMMVSQGWNSAQVKAAMQAEYKYNPAVIQTGSAAAAKDMVEQTAAAYGVNMTPAIMESLVTATVQGRIDANGVKEFGKSYAKLLYPTIAKEIDQGITVRDYFQPYINSAAKLLEMNPAEIDITQSKWQRPITQVDPQTGQRGVMSLWDWEKTLKTDDAYNYRYTKNAREETTAMINQLSKSMGVTA